MKLGNITLEMHQGINTVADKVEYQNVGTPIIQSKNITSGYLDLDDVKYLGISDKNKYFNKYNPQKGDILLANIGTIGKSIVVEDDIEFLIAWNLFLIRVDIEQYKPQYIKYYFDYLLKNNKFNSLLSGGTVKFINKKKMKDLDIPESSIEHQSDIINKLNKISKILDDKKKQLSLLDNLIKSRFIELFGDPETNPKGFKKVLLSEIAEYFNGLTYSPDNVTNDGTVVLRSSNIQNSQLDFVDTVRVDCPIKEKLYVKNNDILMCSRNGSARLVGKVALIKNPSEPMTFGAFMMIIRSRYYPYLMTYFQMDAFRRQIATGATTTINQITGNMLNKISLPLPNMADINEFATFVEQTDKSKVAIQKSIDELQQLFDSLMQEYFG
ncbi:MAG: restriction endonuclease subunit S [Erysipelotrichaceae bacterium]|nr:restriction endonuclease subunit S [Erysipelotrichaceae bacterium]